MARGSPVEEGWARWGALLASDGLGALLALHAALALRFDGRVPAQWLEPAGRAAALLVACRVGAGCVARLHRWPFRLAGLPDALRLCGAALGGSLAFVALAGGLMPGSLPRSVYVLELLVFCAISGAVRFGPRAALHWARTSWPRDHAARALVAGGDGPAELAARTLERAPAPYRLVGFAADDRNAVGAILAGRPVLGTVGDLPALVARHKVDVVVLAEPFRSPARARRLMEACAASRVRFELAPGPLHEGRGLELLAGVAPEDLLARERVQFDERELRALVAGRRALVTGGGGSIGAELCRQLARFGARQLVLVDINENELYLGRRRLAEQYPALELHAEVADVREPEPLLRLGERYRPHDVFHAAAHKHVPLMEDAPEEAVKNNVFGTRNAARMADRCGAERFVLISTDKAVKPSSVMGASKRVAELVVRDLARASRTRMTVVRFGNVLGSAGSVIPIFKEQINRGGPVTVTHPECTRYFMTVQEAVGLTLLAGLGGYGELCVLEMGEPVGIAALARQLVALSGRPDVEVVYTGLRPGEKLREELLTEEEEDSQQVRNRIRVAWSPAPPADLQLKLVELRRLAEAGEPDGVLALLRALVPTYRPQRGGAPAPVVTPAPAPRPAAAVALGAALPVVAAVVHRPNETMRPEQAGGWFSLE